MPISQEGENAKIPKRDFVPGGHYAKITKRERVQEGVIAKVFEGVIVLVGDYSRGCTCQALQEGENARGAKMLGGRVSVSPAARLDACFWTDSKMEERRRQNFGH